MRMILREKKIFCVLLVVLFFVIGFFIGKATNAPSSAVSRIRRIQENNSEGRYRFINPLLGVEATNQNERYYKSLKQKLEDYIKLEKKSSNANTVSVYFRNLNSVRWFDINGDEKYVPGSLMKVVLMIAYFKSAESDPDLLVKKLYYGGAYDLNKFEYFAPEASLTPKRWYTVKQLMARMIVESGNNSTYLLSKDFDENVLKDTALDLGIEFPDSAEFVDYLSVKAYSLVFRVLYNSTYLSRAMSEEALRMLSETTFKQGLVARVPADVVIAHKFGEHSLQLNKEQQSVKELHDCGIVYHQDAPYFLCVMTKGKDYEKLADIIAEISRIVFAYVNEEPTGYFR